MNIVIAEVTLRSTAPYTQSRKHDVDKLEGEGADAYEKRTWKEHMHVRTYNRGKASERTTVVIPAAGMNLAIAAGAKYMNRKIEGQKNNTWTKHFAAGVAVTEDIDLKIDPETCECQTIHAHANGVRGSGTRVKRFFPKFAAWEATFEVMVLDPLITESIFGEVLENAGLFIGVGQHRPEQLGTNGRWEIVNIDWRDDRKRATLKKAA